MRNTRDTLERIERRVRTRSLTRGMSSRLWASLKARSSPRNHGGDGPRPVLQPTRDQVCQWRRCVCGVCFCASSRSFPSLLRPNRSISSVFPVFFFFLSRTKVREREWEAVACGWRANLSMAKVEVERTRGSVSQKTFFQGGFDGWNRSINRNGEWLARFFPIHGSVLTAAYRPPNDAINRIETRFYLHLERESFLSRKNSAPPSLLFEEIITKLRLFYGEARTMLFRWNGDDASPVIRTNRRIFQRNRFS